MHLPKSKNHFTEYNCLYAKEEKAIHSRPKGQGFLALNIKKKYPKKFVAIKNQNVVVAASKLETLINILKEKFGNPNDYLIDFVPDDKYILVV